MSFLKGVDIMSIDKSWINLSSRSYEEYINGVIEFVDYAFQHIKDEDMKIKCPCNDCNNRSLVLIDISNMVLGFNYVFVD